MYVLIRSGKIQVIGPFTSIQSAAAYMGSKEMLGYQIIPLSSPEKLPSTPPQTEEAFHAWAMSQTYNRSIRSARRNRDFARRAFETFGPFLGVGTGAHHKVSVIKELRRWVVENEPDRENWLGFYEAKKAVDEVVDEMWERAND